MQLVIAEKPSVAQSIAKILGATSRKDGYIEGNNYIVSWCVGHLVELAAADSYNEKYAKWRYEDLPILPALWQYQVSASTKKQFTVLKKLLNDNQVDTVICATDAGREGELIFRLVYEKAGCNKPVKRLWISSLEDTAIQKGFKNLKDGKEYENLYQAALCRAKADWIVGINATRLFSVLYGQTLNIGRVMSPTLAMICERDVAISEFKPEPFYTLHLTCNDFSLVGEKLKSKAQAKEVLQACDGQSVTIESVEQKVKYFTATHKGTALITVLPEQVQSPLMTAEWEEKLKLVEYGELTADAFLLEIVDMTSALVKTYEVIKGADTLFPSDRESMGKCPRCGGDITENKKGFCCSDKCCNFAIWKENRFFTAKKKTVTKAIVAELLKNGKVSLTGCYSEKTGKTYDCIAVLDDTGGQFVNFIMEFGAKKK